MPPVTPPAAPRQDRILDASPRSIDKAARLIKAGKLVAFPTETVYGLGADATNEMAVATVYAAKGRPAFNPLIVHVPDRDAAAGIAVFSALADTLAQLFWPGALTLVLPRSPRSARSAVTPLLSAGLDTVAVRVPRHPVALALLRRCATPIAAPSANRSGRVSPTSADHVVVSLGDKVDLILDGGACPIGLESTVIDLSGENPVLLRPGGIAEEIIEAAIGPLSRWTGGNGVAARSPGMQQRHYAPNTPLRLNADGAEPGEALLAFGPEAPRRALNLSRKGDVTEAAANLFAMLHLLDQSGLRSIAVSPIPEEGLGRAINDRLRRAAAADGDDSG